MSDIQSEPQQSRPTSVHVVVGNEQEAIDIDPPRWGSLATEVLRSLGKAGELTLTFVSIDEMTDLNGEYMGKSGPTDVLSFPMDDDSPDEPNVGPILLGDVVICPAVAAEAAPSHAGCLDDELALLTVHGILHVLGHDHAEPSEAAVMRAIEMQMLVEHHWRGPAPSGFTQEQDD